MLTESFINTCYSIILSTGDRIKKNKNLFRDILEIISVYDNKSSIEIPINIITKVDCLKTICKLKLEDRNIDNIIDSVINSKKYDKIKGFIEGKLIEELAGEILDDNIRQLRFRKKLNHLFNNIDKIDSIVNLVKNGNYDSIDNIILDYENVIKTVYTKMLDEERFIEIESLSSLDFNNCNFQSIRTQILNSHDTSNRTKSGYQILDRDILKGGFSPKRLYVFGGGTGSGKSTLVLNFIVNSIVNYKHVLNNNSLIEQQITDNNSIENLYLYFTLENSIDESFMRVCQILFNKTEDEILADLNNDVDLSRQCNKIFTQAKSTLVMRYYPSKSISCTDIRSEIDNIKSNYPNANIKGIYVDYLDLLSTDIKYDMYRIELGDITLGLKRIAIDYQTPVITVTQLTRSVYKIKNSDELSLDQMSESIKKVEHSDFVALLVKDKMNENLVKFKVVKNRSGKSNFSYEFSVDFTKYKFISGNKPKNDQNNSCGLTGFVNVSSTQQQLPNVKNHSFNNFSRTKPSYNMGGV